MTSANGENKMMLDAPTVGFDEVESKALVAGFTIPVPAGGRVVTEEDVHDLVQRLHPPLVVKILSKSPIHKSDVGGVKVGLGSAHEVLDTIATMQADPRIPHELITGFIVEEMADGEHELIIGGRVDPSFGPVIMVGAGGVYIHVLDDVSVRVCPITAADALDMVRELRISPALFGARGQTPVDVDALVDAIVRIGGEDGLLLRHESEIAELDINPLLVGPAGICAVDVRIVAAEEGAA